MGQPMQECLLHGVSCQTPPLLINMPRRHQNIIAQTVMLRYAMLSHAMPCNAMLCYAMPWCAVLCYAVLRYAMQHNATPCSKVLCYARDHCMQALGVHAT